MGEQEHNERKAQLAERLEEYKAMQAVLTEPSQAHARMQGKINDLVEEILRLGFVHENGQQMYTNSGGASAGR
ncbi:hypothetical protein [Streptomyces virginiae]|uniref:hypothetical protein n=1 Tax=Streptomyces virginiae TaxID=1961 RepID=UPI00332BF9DD